MGLGEFLRQWQGSRLAGGVALSVLLHLLVIAALLWGPPPFAKTMVKRGEPLFVELPPAPDSPPPGTPGAPRPATPPAAPPAPKPQPAPPARTVVAARPPAPRAEAPRAPAPTPPTTPAAPQHRTEPAPVPKAPDAEAPSPPAVAAPPEPAPATPSTAESVQPPAPAPPAPPMVAAVPPAPPARPVPDIRSLRRGTGGAGGSGDGRAGIEGEPIPLDSADPRYSDYLDQIRRRIKDKWGYPCVKNDHTRECEYKTAQLVIEFGIAKDGKVPFINVVRSSGYPIYDDYAVNAVKLADFPPIPDSFSKKGVPILATFSYVVQSSLTNILR
jgi:homeobox protein ESX1